MRRSDLVGRFALEKGITDAVAERIVQTIFRSMAQTLIAGGRIEIRGFGSFEIREYDGYTAHNPKTRVEIQVAPKKLPFFKTGKELNERIQAGGQ